MNEHSDVPRAAEDLSSEPLGVRFTAAILEPIKRVFVGKDEVVDLLGVSLIARENLFILGPPGTAKSALVQELARRIDGRIFDYLLTRFTEPNELFGPFDIRKLREGELLTNTEGMLPEADFVFLDELLNANSAILNSLLMVLNERIFRRGRETRSLPTLIVVGASNGLPEDEALAALFDRFLLRVRCDNVEAEKLENVLTAGWELDKQLKVENATVTVENIRCLQKQIHDVDLTVIRKPYLNLIHRLRHAGISVSDRRAVKLQRLIAASALLCGRQEALVSDLWVLRYIWDTEEQIDVLASLVQDVLKDEDEETNVHPRAKGHDAPDADQLARGIEQISQQLNVDDATAIQRTYLRDQLGLLASRLQWLDNSQQRGHLQNRIDEIWKQLETTP
ncbi:MAG: MoxR-like ATPase [Pirellulaceae bacterium]|jgi:MoxR-like ATPase